MTLSSINYSPYIIIAAMDKEGGFAKNGEIPWYYSEDFKWFKKLTNNHVCVMGRKTYEDINNRMGDRGFPDVLPNRRCFVVSTTLTSLPNATVISCLTDVEKHINKHVDTIFVIGGQSLFEDAILKSNLSYISIIDKVFDCDRFLPIDYMKDQFEFEIQKQHYDNELTFYKITRKVLLCY